MAQAYKSRLRNWPQIKDGDSAALQEFSDFLFRCQEAVKITGSISELDSNENLVHFSANPYQTDVYVKCLQISVTYLSQHCSYLQ